MSKERAKGTAFESDIVNYLRAFRLDADRLPRTGVKDEGDILVRDYHGDPWILEAKNTRSIDLASAVNEAGVEAENWSAKHVTVHGDAHAAGVAVVKRRGKGVADAYVVIPLHDFVRYVLG